ncbi:MAG: hypothetical protein PHV30_10590 [Candidatus Margulisbacteria bacterium]|nr:hypothetical protein [Candidatus Margulisiibacteriota bacterium]
MEFVVFSIICFFLLSAQIYIGTNQFKDGVAKVIGEKAFKASYRLFYILLSLIAYIVCIKLFLQLPRVEIYNLEDSVSNLVFLIIDTIRFIALFLIIEALWELDLYEFLGIKQIWYFLTKKDLTIFKRNRIRDKEFIPKGLYLRHRHPVYFYMFIFFILDRSMTVSNILFIVIFTIYYNFSARQQEARFMEDYGDSYKKYQQKVNKFLPMFKRFSAHEQPKK